MHLKLAILTVTIGLISPMGLCENVYDEAQAKQLFLTKCSTCHEVDGYGLDSRSIKEWQLVVERMSDYSDPDRFTEDEIDQIVMFLYGGTFQAKAAKKPAVPPAAVASIDTPPAPKPIVSWRKSKAIKIAKLMAYVAFGAMALMVLSGLLRMKLKRNFRPIHTALAIALFGSLAIHVSVYLCEYGTPSVLWLWFGIAAAILIALVEFGGLLRNKLGAKFIRIHATCGVISFVLVILHWVWIYM